MSLDHGVLNVPLSKRGDIDREIDRHKAQQAADRKAKATDEAAKVRELRPRARAVVDAADPEMLARVAASAGITVAKVRANLRSDAYFRPAWVIRVFGGAA